MAKKAIIIGATSGIGKELAIVMSQNNYIVGLAGRRMRLLDELKEELSNNSLIKRIDVAKVDEATSFVSRSSRTGARCNWSGTARTARLEISLDDCFAAFRSSNISKIGLPI